MPNDKAQIKTLDSHDLKVRIGIIATVICALIFGWFAVRWQFGNMLAILTASSEPNAEEIARFASDLAPRDPESNWLLAETKKEIFSSDQSSSTINNYEKVVRLSPFDYRWWIELGRSFEQAEEL